MSKKNLFNSKGYTKFSILDKHEVESFTALIKAYYSIKNAKELQRISLLTPDNLNVDIASIVYNPKLIEALSNILPQPLILDNAILFYGMKEMTYKQGWHRDILQLPKHLILDSMFSEGHFHNSVQVNLALNEDHCFQLIPGSHIRAYTNEERHAIDPETQLSFPDITLKNAQTVVVKPGQALLYNNNLIHRGYLPTLSKEDRITFHLGYHSSAYKPTCHFYGLDLSAYNEELIISLPSKLRQVVLTHLEEKKKYPDTEEIFQSHKGVIQNQLNQDEK